jgi:hypothetical protein
LNAATRTIHARFSPKAANRIMRGILLGAALLAIWKMTQLDLPHHEPDNCQTVASDDRGVHLQLAQPVTPTMAAPPACMMSPSIQIVR